MKILTDPPSTVAAVDGSYRYHTLGFGYLGDTGSWWLRLRPLAAHERRGPRALHAELHSLASAIQHHPGPLDVLCDCLAAVELVHAWQAGQSDPIPGYSGSRLRTLGASVLARSAPLSVRWVPSHAGHPLNEGADALARLASRALTDGLSMPAVRSRAVGIASAFALAFAASESSMLETEIGV
jgi:hypothetical protein